MKIIHLITAFHAGGAEKIAIDIDRLKSLGVKFEFSKKLGQDINIQTLKKEYDNIFIGTGAQLAIALDIDNKNATGIYDFLEFS